MNIGAEQKKTTSATFGCRNH